MWIGGSDVRTASTRAVRVPFDGSVAGTVYEAGPAEVNAAIEAAQKAAPVMRGLSRHERSSILYQAHRLLGERREEMARAIASESGNITAMSRSSKKR